MAEKPNSLVGKTVAKKYVITSLIGRGRSSEVFEATQLVTQRRVALKVAHVVAPPDTWERVRREALALGVLHHPHICNIHDVGELEDGRPYLALERLHGDTLALRLVKVGPLALREVFEIFTQVLSALHTAHGSGIIHRDIRPANILLTETIGCAPLVKLIDFGFAKDIARTTAPITRKDLAFPFPGYLPPEQLMHERTVDRRADIFSTGVVMFEALTTAHPFGAGNMMDVAARILREEPTPLRALRADAPEKLESVVQRALAKAPADRWQTAADLQKALADAIAA